MEGNMANTGPRDRFHPARATAGVGRRELITLLGGAAAAWPLAARAQQAGKVARIGVLMGIAESDPEARPRAMAFQQGLQELGWTDGRNVRIEYRWAADDPERIRTYAAELVSLAPDVLLATTTPVMMALQPATRTIPIVFVQVIDPLARGFVANLARPGGNITGFVTFEFSMGGKWLQTLKQVAPRIKRVATIFNPGTAPFSESFVQVVEAAAPTIAVQTVAARIRDAAELEGVIATFAAKPDGGLIVLPDVFNTSHRDTIIALAARHRLPAVYPFRYFAVSGGLISDGVDTADLFRRSASYVARIIKGAKPGDLPVQTPTKFELVINLKTAKALSLDVPETLLARADEVIE
jgi:putative tryptophan/tyrosine transport system substrate-binding protein